MGKLTLENLEKELNANNIECTLGKTADKIFLNEIKSGFMAYIFEGDYGFIFVVRLKGKDNKAINFKTYTLEQHQECDGYRELLIDEINEKQIYAFKSNKTKEIKVQEPIKNNINVSDMDLLNNDFFNEQ